MQNKQVGLSAFGGIVREISRILSKYFVAQIDI